MMKKKEVTVTPEIAEEWLGKNWRNRTLRKSHIERLARDMKTGNWVLNSETIKFTEDGNLIDGQHRLHACIESGASFVTWVATGCPLNVQASLSGGVPRKFGDELTMRGHAHTALMAGVAKCCAVYDIYGHWDPLHTRNVTYTEQATAFNDHQQGIIECSHFVIERYHKADQRQRVPPTILAGLLFQFRLHNREVADWFAEKCYQGTLLDEDEPVYLLRRLFAPRDPYRRLSHPRRYAFTIRAFNYTLQGRKLAKLYWRQGGPNPEPFPKIGDQDEGDDLQEGLALEGGA